MKKKPFLSRLFKVRKVAENPGKRFATQDDIRKKLEHYRSKEGPANFVSAGVYYVSEVEHDPADEDLAEEVSSK